MARLEENICQKSKYFIHTGTFETTPAYASYLAGI